MIDFAWPGELFNPIAAPRGDALTPIENLAGPYGLIAFLLFVPIVRLVGRRAPHAAIVVGAFAWMVLTTGWVATAITAVIVAVGTLWVVGLGRLVAKGKLSPRAMVALVWIGLTLLVAPLWWAPRWGGDPAQLLALNRLGFGYVTSAWWWLPGWNWYPSRLAPLHGLGIAYFMLRLVGWGVEISKNPNQTRRPLATLCWLCYPPIMRLGPLLPREEFIRRFDDWRAGHMQIAWRDLGRRLALFILGGILVLVIGHNMPRVPAVGADFFTVPENYATRDLIRVFYWAPIGIYLLLWTYNELAAVVGLAVGIRVDNNFDWLPLATSVRDFWRRWHVTVGAWLRKYVYIPLGGNRGWAWMHILAVFVFCGVWHGAAWSFVLWGMSQAVALEVQRGWDHVRDRLGLGRFTRGPMWVGFCWLLTIHYQLATILAFTDFEHCGLRILRELATRLGG